MIPTAAVVTNFSAYQYTRLSKAITPVVRTPTTLFFLNIYFLRRPALSADAVVPRPPLLSPSAKQALWWTGRDAAINKRAWLNHLGQPGCGRESAGRLRPQQRQQQQRRRQHERRHQQQQQQHHRHQPRDRSTHFLGSDRNTAAGRGRGASPSHIGGSGGGGFGGDEYGDDDDDDDDDDDEASAAAAEDSLLPAADWVGILGCRCDACLTEGEDSHEQEEQGLPPRYNDRPPPPYNHHHHQAGFGGPYAAAAPTAYRRDHHYYPPPAPGAGTAVTYGSGAHRGVAARAASKTWPSPEDWDRSGGGGGDELGGKGSRSYSPGSASSSSPLYEACETYGGDDGSYFFDED